MEYWMNVCMSKQILSHEDNDLWDSLGWRKRLGLRIGSSDSLRMDAHCSGGVSLPTSSSRLLSNRPRGGGPPPPLEGVRAGRRERARARLGPAREARHFLFL